MSASNSTLTSIRRKPSAQERRGFRTVPMRLPEAVIATLKSTGAFAKAPYEIWPLLSSPCDMHSLGIIAIRTLLANSKSNLPVIVDDVLGLARMWARTMKGRRSFIPG